jgi:ATP-binding cassette subfamily A (ABC1) protein 3
LLYLIVAGFSVGMCKLLEISALIDDGAFIATCLLFGLFGVSNILLTYIMAYLFKDYGNAQGVIYFFNFVGGGIAPIIILVLRWISESSNKIGRGIAWLLRIIPSFSFGEGLLNISSMKILVTF